MKIPKRLQRKIDVYGKVKATNELNQTTYTNSLIISTMAEIIPQTGNMQHQVVETMLTNVTHKITCRYNKTIMDIYQQQQKKNDMYIMFNGHRFDVIYILNPYFTNQTLEIYVTEVIG